MSETVARDDSAVSAGRRGAAGFIVLDRPKALNALTLPMARAIAAALDDFERDARVTRVVVMSAGGRAFCSGGDIRLFYELGRAGDHAAQLAFWREEYRLNRRIERFPKPFVALIDGIVMGGASASASTRRIASPASAACSPCRKSASASSPTSARPMSWRAWRAASAPSSPRPASAPRPATWSRSVWRRPSRRVQPFRI